MLVTGQPPFGSQIAVFIGAVSLAEKSGITGVPSGFSLDAAGLPQLHILNYLDYASGA
jgi:hypothetical protein